MVRACSGATTLAAVAAGEEGDDDAEEGDDAVDDGSQDATDAVNDSHDAASDGAESVTDLSQVHQYPVYQLRSAGRGTYARYDSAHCEMYLCVRWSTGKSVLNLDCMILFV